jgi:hypothetical protein
MDRRTFTKSAIAGIASAPVAYALQQAASSTNAQKTAPKPPALGFDMVKEFVIAAHGNMEKTKKMLEAQPSLVNATWDWGGGDWETGLGGASHVGSAAIAEYLLSMGARMDVFCAAMLGRIDIVKAFLAADPKIVDLPGPHRIPLIRHAIAGKQDAVVELLKAHGAKA